MAVNHEALARARAQLGATSRRNAAACTDPAEARHHLDIACAIDPAEFAITLDTSDGRHFAVIGRGACLADALVRVIQTYVPADAADLIVAIGAVRTESLPSEACLA